MDEEGKSFYSIGRNEPLSYCHPTSVREKLMRTRITRDSGTSQVARIARARARYESTRSVRALRSVDDGKSSDRAVLSLAAEGIINTPDTDTRGVSP